MSPRFGIMLASMCLSIAFIIVDTCAVLNAFEGSGLPTGIEPFWKVSLRQLNPAGTSSFFCFRGLERIDPSVVMGLMG